MLQLAVLARCSAVRHPYDVRPAFRPQGPVVLFGGRLGERERAETLTLTAPQAVCSRRRLHAFLAKDTDGR